MLYILSSTVHGGDADRIFFTWYKALSISLNSSDVRFPGCAPFTSLPKSLNLEVSAEGGTTSGTKEMVIECKMVQNDTHLLLMEPSIKARLISQWSSMKWNPDNRAARAKIFPTTCHWWRNSQRRQQRSAIHQALVPPCIWCTLSMRKATECTLWRCVYTDIGISLDTHVCLRKSQMQAKRQSLLILVRWRCRNPLFLRLTIRDLCVSSILTWR